MNWNTAKLARADTADLMSEKERKTYYFIIGKNQVLVFEFICNTADKDTAVKAVENLFEHFHYPTLGS